MKEFGLEFGYFVCARFQILFNASEFFIQRRILVLQRVHKTFHLSHLTHSFPVKKQDIFLQYFNLEHSETSNMCNLLGAIKLNYSPFKYTSLA